MLDSESDRLSPPEEVASNGSSESGSPSLPDNSPSNPEPDRSPLSLEDRVRRLEDVIASLQLASPEWVDTTLAARPPREPSPTGVTTAPAAAPSSPSFRPDTGPTPSPLRPKHTQWLLVDIYAELRCIPRMILDPRYRLTWQTVLLGPLLIGAIILSKWMIGQIPLIGWLLDFVLFPILLYILFKVISREATRYRLTSPDLPASLRL